MRKGLVSVVLAGLAACTPCDYQKLSKLPLASSVPEEYQDDVTFVKEVRKFGIEQLGLNQCTQHYTTFSRTDQEAKTLYRLFVTKPTELPTDREENFRHYFEHLTAFREEIEAGYFWSYEDTLEDESAYYKKQGYDVYSRNVQDFNEVGSDQGSSLTPSFFNVSPERQANIMLHEICHDTLEEWIGKFPSDLNEPFCVLVEYAGTAEYYRLKKGVSSPEYKKARESFAAYGENAEKINLVYRRLQELYKSDKSLAEKERERQALFAVAKETVGVDVNNASLWDRYPYVKYYQLMLKMYNAQDKDIYKVLQKMRNCPKDEENALKYIQGLAK